jgi:hypothetical protein
VLISGEVRAPGPLEIAAGERLTLSEAILRAGNFTQWAKKEKVKLTRGGAQQIYDVRKITAEGAPRMIPCCRMEIAFTWTKTGLISGETSDMEPPLTNASGGSFAGALRIKIFRVRAIVRRYWWILFLTVAAGIGIQSWVVYSKPDLFNSSSDLMVREELKSDLSNQYYDYYGSMIGNTLKMLQSPDVLDRARRRIELQAPPAYGIGLVSWHRSLHELRFLPLAGQVLIRVHASLCRSGCC